MQKGTHQVTHCIDLPRARIPTHWGCLSDRSTPVSTPVSSRTKPTRITTWFWFKVLWVLRFAELRLRLIGKSNSRVVAECHTTKCDWRSSAASPRQSYLYYTIRMSTSYQYLSIEKEHILDVESWSWKIHTLLYADRWQHGHGVARAAFRKEPFHVLSPPLQN